MRITDRTKFDAEDFGISTFGVTHELRLTEQNGKDDPYTFRAAFTAELHTQENTKTQDGRPKVVYRYNVSGQISCPEFELEDYFVLKRKFLVFKSADQKLLNKKPSFKIEGTRWDYSPRSGDAVSSSEGSFKTAASQALASHVRSNAQLLENIKIAIQSFYKTLDAEIAALTPIDIVEFKTLIGLAKVMGTYPREHTSNILGYLFGSGLQFYNGDEVRNENGVMLVPGYWVRETEQEFTDKQKRYLGYGMKPAVVDFGFEPYPWAMIRINAIWNNIDKIIREKVSFGQPKNSFLSGLQVYIIGKRNDKMAFKALDKQYFAGGKLADDRMEVLTSLALGQLEADLQESDQK